LVDERRIPGEAGVWVLILGDMSVFAVLFGTFVYYRDKAPHAFTRAQTALHSIFGVSNTLLLLTSSLAVALAVRWLRSSMQTAAGSDDAEALRRRAQVALWIALACAAGFLINKGLEWSSLLSAGHDPSGNGFFTYFFVLTGLHALHLIVASCVLVAILVLSKRDQLTRGQLIFIEGGACFWHMVDIIWIVLFALLYLAH
jgi:nitric oxide reductase NorE protein